ncbi:MAG: endonuclease domain-containing protein [Proteobacteria bacterium]|nr:endonuclease domain-containing protein [Pseudomonadota bacterium]MCL2307464.1 endonuclease domain-containing protein [Pseudomonadota bacterium]
MTTANTQQIAKTLRKYQTDAEQKLWFHLRGKRFDGVKFKRQKPIGSYIVDFVAVNERLVIELDGGQHQKRMAYDQARTAYLESRGYRVLRFWNNECLAETEAVLESIRLALSPTPLPQAGEGNNLRHRRKNVAANF